MASFFLRVVCFWESPLPWFGYLPPFKLGASLKESCLYGGQGQRLMTKVRSIKGGLRVTWLEAIT